MTRLAVIGLGYWGPNLVRNFHHLLGGDLRICCDQSPQRGRAIQQNYPTVQIETDAESVFRNPEIDAVAIATPVGTHYELAKSALLAGKSVFIEKPLTASVRQAQELVELARELGLVLMVDHVFIHNHAVQKMKQLIDAGHIGKLLFVDSVRINLGKIQNDVNVIWDLAPHDLSIVNYLVGRPPQSVSAFGASHTEQGLEDVAYLNLDFGDGLIASFHLNWLSPVKVRYTMVGGSDKSMIFNDQHPAEIIKVYDSGVSVQHEDIENRRRMLVDYRTGDIWSPHIPPCEPLKNAAADFVRAIETGSRPLTDGEDGLQVVRILEAAQKSIEQQGQRISLAQGQYPDHRTPASAANPVADRPLLAASASDPIATNGAGELAR